MDEALTKRNWTARSLGTIKIPYLVSKPSGHYWEPGPKLRKRGYKTVALGTDKPTAITHAQRLNEQAKRDRFKVAALCPYSVSYLCAKYLESSRFLERADATQREYKRLLKILEGMEVGETKRRFGDFDASSVKARHADAIHEKVQKERGLASANSMARTARAVWKWGIRKEHVRGLTQDQNPWAKMMLETMPQREQIWTPEQVQSFIEKAIEKGWQSMGLAARLAYDGGPPEGDILGIWHDNPDGTEEWRDGFCWTDYKAGAIAKKRNKTGVAIFIPVTEYPELQAMLDEMKQPGGPMVVCETTKRPWKADHFRHIFREVAREAGIPDDLQFRDLRATATTELIDAEANHPSGRLACRSVDGGDDPPLRPAHPEAGDRRREEARQAENGARRKVGKAVGTPVGKDRFSRQPIVAIYLCNPSFEMVGAEGLEPTTR